MKGRDLDRRIGCAVMTVIAFVAFCVVCAAYGVYSIGRVIGGVVL